MKVMILAAGRGNRLRPLTDTCPKPLIKVCGKPLIVYHLENLAAAGFTEIVINVRHLGEKIQAALGNGHAFGVNIAYSVEDTELEVGGGIHNALPLLGNSPFVIVNGDIWTDYPFASLKHKNKGLAYLVLVDNPEHNLKGDYAILKNNVLKRDQLLPTFTYSGISVLHPDLFKEEVRGTSFRLAKCLDKAAQADLLFGEYFDGQWTDVGTLERLQFLEQSLCSDKIR
ncbi:MAG: nucleotidyltransferase family protein [Proteobacteria bacterium]|nr:nucleotidyltransferase family protein [Pseudomonadota bacterium]